VVEMDADTLDEVVSAAQIFALSLSMHGQPFVPAHHQPASLLLPPSSPPPTPAHCAATLAKSLPLPYCGRRMTPLRRLHASAIACT
jgi:hypothetical protein